MFLINGVLCSMLIKLWRHVFTYHHLRMDAEKTFSQNWCFTFLNLWKGMGNSWGCWVSMLAQFIVLGVLLTLWMPSKREDDILPKACCYVICDATGIGFLLFCNYLHWSFIISLTNKIVFIELYLYLTLDISDQFGSMKGALSLLKVWWPIGNWACQLEVSWKWFKRDAILDASQAHKQSK